jgi:hypothetical protein
MKRSSYRSEWVEWITLWSTILVFFPLVWSSQGLSSKSCSTASWPAGDSYEQGVRNFGLA